MKRPQAPSDIRIAIVEADPSRRDELASLLEATPGTCVAGRYESVEAALAGCDFAPPEVALVSTGAASALPGDIARFAARFPAVGVLVLAGEATDREAFDAIWSGASGFLEGETPPERLLAAVRELREGGAPMSPRVAKALVAEFRKGAPVSRGKPLLSPRERDTLRLLSEGHSYKTAASALGLSVDTVRYHVRNIYEKLHVHSKVEAVLRAMRDGLT